MNLRELREKAGMSQSAAAAASGLRQTYIIALELAKTPNPGIEAVDALAKAYDVPVDVVISAVRATVAA